MQPLKQEFILYGWRYSEAISLYKNRDASAEAASNKIFIGFIALILCCLMYTILKGLRTENLEYMERAIQDMEELPFN